MSTGGHARISPDTLDLRRTFRRSRCVYVVEERDQAGRWVERERFASFHDAAETLDRLSAGSQRQLRIRELDPHRWVSVAATVAAVVVALAGIAWVAYILFG